MAKTLEQMKKELLERTKKNYERKEQETGAKYYKQDKIDDVKFWRASPTKGNPHIIDIVPFEAGDNFPEQSGITEGDLVYSLDLWVHPNVGPGKTSVICPAKNYGLPCPVCDEIDEMTKEGIEWNDIPFTPKRRVLYNIVVMDDAKTEAQGLQVWDVSYKYMEEPILGLSKSPRTGGVIAFAAPDRSSGRSIAFDVGSDTYKKITGHRFEARDYDLSQDVLDAAVQLDQIINVLSEDQIKKILYGSSSSKQNEDEKEEVSSRRSRKKEEDVNDDIVDDGGDNNDDDSSKTKTCPYGGEFGVNFDEYQECDDCECKQECSDAKDAAELEKEKAEKEAPQRRTLLRRNKK